MKRIGLLMFALALLLAACAAPAEEGPELTETEDPALTETESLDEDLDEDVHAPAAVCKCLPEFTVDTEFGDGYGVNLSENYARCEAGQAPLTAEQTETIRGIVERNCK